MPDTSISRRSLLAGALLALPGLAPLALGGCSEPDPVSPGEEDEEKGLATLGAPATVPLAHATQFSLESYEGGHRLASLANGDRFLIVPEGADAPADLPGDVAAIRLPIEGVYLVSTAMICLVDAIGALDAVAVSSVRAEDSPVEDFAARLEDGRISYGGIYRSPDYELVAATGCPLAIENTNIDHVPEVRAKLEELGVTVLMEQSSREGDMLGRLEWIKLMGALFGRDEEAAAVFDDVAARVDEVSREAPTGRSVAFFYVNEDGAAVTRRAGDYFCQMIEAAGGEYVSFSEEGAADSSPTTVTVEMEAFYAGARDADVIIYNGTIDDGVASLDALVKKNELLADFRAVREGRVWACDSNLYQQITSMADIIEDVRRALTDSGEPTTYVWRLE
ncbi:ABC transporter substrate-binding protein [Thermophilibacter mediterraneus]|uniref:ABC transporter substrate-binding protein n=1 Tax=Thermophilibacter mediterraneus TaxID=1871031 RepID=UPI0009300FAD|nr:ABC transporter substrate-binding protein [Thermophilibacter mediterraneus]